MLQRFNDFNGAKIVLKNLEQFKFIKIINVDETHENIDIKVNDKNLLNVIVNGLNKHDFTILSQNGQNLTIGGGA